MGANSNRDDSFLMDESSPEIYVACLASYNAGRLHGKWFDATLEIEELLREIQALLAKGPTPDAEEFLIHDYEGFYSLKIDEYESLKSIHEKAVFISEHGALGAALVHHCDGDLEAAAEAMNERYQGEYKNELDYSIYLFHELYAIPEDAHKYIDYEAFKTDIFLTDCFSIELQGCCHVFSWD